MRKSPHRKQKQSSDPIRMNRTDIHIVIAPNDLCYAESITRFQVDMAMESEGLSLDFSRTLKGVQSVLQDESKGRYVLAIINGKPVKVSYTMPVAFYFRN